MGAAEVGVGETVLVKSGMKVPVDGVVSGGVGAIDEASITGESIPVEKADGDPVYAGTVAVSGLLQVTATGVGVDTTLARIIHRVEEAQDAKARTAQFMDRFSAWYTPAIIVLAVVVGLVTRDVVLALTLLVIACPGALVISIPVSIVAGIGRGARDGILIKGGEYLETAARIDAVAVAVDKTGTLTEGRPYVTDVVALATEGADRTDEDEVLLASRTRWTPLPCAWSTASVQMLRARLANTVSCRCSRSSTQRYRVVRPTSSRSARGDPRGRSPAIRGGGCRGRTPEPRLARAALPVQREGVLPSGPARSPGR